MRQVGTFEAKTHFSEIIAQVIEGEKIIITKHGVEVAMIIPYKKNDGVSSVRDTIEEIIRLRKGITLGNQLSIREMREAGRK